MSPELIAVCQQLLKSGKPVSVGMVKARAPKHTPLPAIVQAVQFCKAQAATVLEMDVSEAPEPSGDKDMSEQEVIARMANKITELEQRIAVLESIVKD